jgi:hypothetical protein
VLDTTIPPDDYLAAFQKWQPDAGCLAAGDQYVGYAIRCFTAAGLSDAQINQRVCDLIGVCAYAYTPAQERYDAAISLARHCALMGMSPRHIVAVLAYLAAEVPCWPDPDDIAEIAQFAVAECAA